MAMMGKRVQCFPIFSKCQHFPRLWELYTLLSIGVFLPYDPENQCPLVSSMGKLPNLNLTLGVLCVCVCVCICGCSMGISCMVRKMEILVARRAVKERGKVTLLMREPLLNSPRLLQVSAFTKTLYSGATVDHSDNNPF